MGRQNSSIVDYWLTEEGLLLLECWARDFLYGDIYVKMGISHQTFAVWREKYPEIQNALSKGKEIVDYKVENALLKRALGFKTQECKVIMDRIPGTDGGYTTRTETIDKEVAPDVTACLAWLNNRKPEQWKKNRDNLFELKDEQRNITINVVSNKPTKELEDDWDDEDNINNIKK